MICSHPKSNISIEGLKYYVEALYVFLVHTVQYNVDFCQHTLWYIWMRIRAYIYLMYRYTLFSEYYV